MLSFFPRDVLDEIWDLIESVSEGFPSYSLNMSKKLDICTFRLSWFSLGIVFTILFSFGVEGRVC